MAEISSVSTGEVTLEGTEDMSPVEAEDMSSFDETGDKSSIEAEDAESLEAGEVHLVEKRRIEVGCIYDMRIIKASIKYVLRHLTTPNAS